MKKGEIYEGIITEYEFPNKGILEYTEEEKNTKVIVKGAFEGQKIRFQLNKKRKGKCEGRLLEVLEKSYLQDRAAECMHFGECGGCIYQELSYTNQLALKGDMVKDIISKVCDDFQYEGILGSPFEWGYRNKMEFSFGDEYKDGPLALGLHKKGSFHDIVTTKDCRIVNEDYNIILNEIQTFFENLNFPFFHKMRHEGYLRHLVIRRAIKTGEILINIVTSTQFDQIDACKKYNEKYLFEELRDKLLTLDLYGKIAGIIHTYNDSLSDVVKSDNSDILYGQDFITEKLLGLQFKISSFSFFQTNTLGAEVLYQKVREYVGETEDKSIFDLYSGTGTIAQIVAPVAKKIIGVEIVEEAVEAARVNAEINNLSNCEFIAGDVLKVIDSITDKPDIIILDPPRDGVHPKALDKIIDYGVDKIVYISCKPTSLARDLVIFQEKGYKVTKVSAVEMYPQTAHVEAVVLMSRVK